ncbi:MAG: bifunctional (p)ppGpp synthetase/guanosine-3',5'-bis(diphosphate) 3'-pyrophosphohydrolase [Thermodesulfobacteria bacterium]|nr:bifunctional (p)ppGpp synthetase/guanosine-3',5'-bis(diphosphate) 3'-pyrophosphohydrolase [Thermodesulfobacteriota bacterium]
MTKPYVIRLSDILDRIQSYLPGADTTLVEKAYVFAAKAHAGQVRRSGEPYLSHPLAVAYTLAEMKLDLPTIAAGLLHDTVEDADVTIEDIRRLFGDSVAEIVDGVTKISNLPVRSKLHKQAENFRKMLLAMANDLRVVLVKLADRLHNMRTLEFQPEHKRRRIARETLEIYAPLASRLGIDWLKQELEDLSFMYLHPEEYRALRDEVERVVAARQDFIEEVKRIIAQKLKEEGIEGRVLGRRKHLYSIYRKLQRNNLTIDQLYLVYDIIGFRVIVQKVKECYEVLGLIHSLWKPIPGRFKDYINLPKPNMYQSLHTTVIGPGGRQMEIQIRTEEMDRIANEGIAAHWLYKEAKIIEAGSAKAGQLEWLSRLVELQKELQNPRDFIESLRMDLFPDEVYVFTPQGDIKVLPRGATPVDFAYAIHTEVGHHCARAKVNGRLVPLDYELQTGDIVEIVTASNQKPSRDWLKFVKTSRARSRIRQWLKQEEKQRILSAGREILDREFRKVKLTLSQFLDDPRAEEVVKAFSFKTMEDLIIAVGYGRLTAQQVVRKFTLLREGEEEPSEEAMVVKKPRPDRGEDTLSVEGSEDVLFHLSRCCKPLPGDEVVGYITRGRGITVHRADCPNVKTLDPERLIEVQWEASNGAIYPARLWVITADRKGMLATISGAISACEANILEAEVKTTPDKRALFNFLVEVSDRGHLDHIMQSVRQIEGVIRVERRFA